MQINELAAATENEHRENVNICRREKSVKLQGTFMSEFL